MTETGQRVEEALFSPAMAEFSQKIASFHRSMYCSLWQEKMEALNTSVLYQSKLHGEGHIRRTMLFGALLAMEQSLSRADAELLLLGCCYHDVGRIGDKTDDSHGARSAQQIGAIVGYADGEELHILQAMVEAHSLDDTVLEEVCKAYKVQALERAKQLSLLLKDADALDRVRIPHLLDTRYFRFSCSHTLLPLAAQLYKTEQNLAQRAG